MSKIGRARRIPFKTLQDVSPVLKVLAHPHRLRMVELLLSEPVPVKQLASMVKLAPSVVSQHLGQMRASGIVAPQREGKQVYYEVISPNAANLIACIRKHGPG